MIWYATEYYPSSLQGYLAVVAPIIIETVPVALLDEALLAQAHLLLGLQVLEAGLGEHSEPSLYGVVLSGDETGYSESFAVGAVDAVGVGHDDEEIRNAVASAEGRDAVDGLGNVDLVRHLFDLPHGPVDLPD